MLTQGNGSGINYHLHEHLSIHVHLPRCNTLLVGKFDIKVLAKLQRIHEDMIKE